MKRTLWMSLLAGVLASAMIGCSPTTTDRAEGTMDSAANDTRNTADNAEDMADNTANRASNSANNAMGDMSRTADNVGDAMTITPMVKNAIIANDQLNDDDNTINVDTVNNVVYLRGTVKSQAMKDLAEKVAMKAVKDANSNATVRNELTVRES